VLPLRMKGNAMRVAKVHRYKGLESPVVVLAEIDERVAESDLAPLLYVGATRARSHLVVVASEPMAADLQGLMVWVPVRHRGGRRL
jgi:superfamily I DNA/RNA helicase